MVSTLWFLADLEMLGRSTIYPTLKRKQINRRRPSHWSLGFSSCHMLLAQISSAKARTKDILTVAEAAVSQWVNELPQFSAACMSAAMGTLGFSYPTQKLVFVWSTHASTYTSSSYITPCNISSSIFLGISYSYYHFIGAGEDNREGHKRHCSPAV